MYRDEILDKSLASLSNEAQEILRKCELLNYDRIIHLDDVGSIMCNDPDFVRLIDFPKRIVSNLGNF